MIHTHPEQLPTSPWPWFIGTMELAGILAVSALILWAISKITGGRFP